MWERFWSQEAGRSRMDFEDRISRILMTFEEATGKGLKESNKNVIRGWRTGNCCYVVAESLTDTVKCS